MAPLPGLEVIQKTALYRCITDLKLSFVEKVACLCTDGR